MQKWWMEVLEDGSSCGWISGRRLNLDSELAVLELLC